MQLEPIRHLQPLPPLHMEHDPERLSGLVRPELVNQVVHVDEEQVQVLDLLLPLGGLGTTDQQVEQVKEVDEDGLKMSLRPSIDRPLLIQRKHVSFLTWLSLCSSFFLSTSFDE